MKEFALAVLLFSSVFALSYPVLSQKKPAKTMSTRNYVRKDLGIAFNKPTGWIASTRNPVPGMVIGFYQDTDGAFQPAITIRVQESLGPVMPVSFEEILDKKYKQDYPGYSLLGTSRFKIAGKDAISIAFNHREPQTDAIIDTRRVYMVNRGKLLIFDIAATVADYDLSLPAFEKMMNSLTFLP